MLATVNKTLPNIFDDVLNGHLFDDAVVKRQHTAPRVNIIEGKENFRIELAAPGLNKEDMKVDVEKDVLTISSEKEMDNQSNDEALLRREFGYNKFSRAFTLPNTVDYEKITATYNNGVLNVIIPKKEEAKDKGPKSIKIA
jgi:HSP20 family protein